MRSLIALAAAVVTLVAVPDAGAKVRCDSGTTAFVEGRLRIFAVFFRTADESGSLDYACLRPGRRPRLVGGRGTSTGLDSGDTPAYAVGGGGRYLAAYERSDGEGGPSASLTVHDLERRRTVAFLDLPCCGAVPAFFVGEDGTLVLRGAGQGVLLKRPGERARRLSTRGTSPGELAVRAGTVFWTEGGEPRSATVATTFAEADRMLEPVRLRRRGGRCAAARGRTVVATGSVRVFDRPDRRFACRVGRAGRFGLGGNPAPAPRIVADRWIVTRREGSARLFDSRTGRRAWALDGVAQSAITREGTFAWLDVSGRLLARRPGSAPVELAPAAAAASPPAAGRRTIYWTESGAPRRYRP